MPEMPPPPPRRPEPTIDSAIFDQDTPVRQPPVFGADSAAVRSNPFTADAPFMPEAADSESSNPFLSEPMAAAPSPQAQQMVAPNSPPNSSAGSARGIPSSQGQPRIILPPAGAPLVSRPGAASPDIRDAHAEFRSGGWKRPLVLVLVAGAVIFGMTLLPGTEKPDPTPATLSKAPPPAVIGRSLPPGRTSDEDVRAAEREQMKAKPEQTAAPSGRPSDIPQEGEFADAFKAAAQ